MPYGADVFNFKGHAEDDVLGNDVNFSRVFVVHSELMDPYGAVESVGFRFAVVMNLR